MAKNNFTLIIYLEMSSFILDISLQIIKFTKSKNLPRQEMFRDDTTLQCSNQPCSVSAVLHILTPCGRFIIPYDITWQRRVLHCPCFRENNNINSSMNRSSRMSYVSLFHGYTHRSHTFRSAIFKPYLMQTYVSTVFNPMALSLRSRSFQYSGTTLK